MSAIVETAIATAGLSHVLATRERGDAAEVRALGASLATVDLLVLGALADQIRAAEVGDVVRIYASVVPDFTDDVVVVAGAAEAGAHTGLGFLRAVALARITGPRAARVRVDWQDIGLELAQVALGFGASELTGAIASKRGLPIAEGAMSGTGKKSAMVPMAAVKKREIAGFVTRSGRRPVFVAQDGSLEEPPAAEAVTAPAEETMGEQA